MHISVIYRSIGTRKCHMLVWYSNILILIHFKNYIYYCYYSSKSYWCALPKNIIIIISSLLLLLCVNCVLLNVSGHVNAMAHMWSLEEHLYESVVSFYHVESRDQIHIFSLRCKCFDPPSYLNSLVINFFKTYLISHDLTTVYSYAINCILLQELLVV